MGVNFDFSDLDNFVDAGKLEVDHVMKEVGEMSVKYAQEHGTYQDRTGMLRKANKSKTVSDGLELTNEMEYASYVESKGYEVLSSAVLEAERELRDKIL